MPRTKSDSTVTHRIEFSPKERQFVEQLVAGQTVKNVVVPAAVTVGVGSAAYIGYKSAKAAWGWGQDLVDDIKATPIGTYTNTAVLTGQLPGMPPAIQGVFKTVRWMFGA